MGQTCSINDPISKDDAYINLAAAIVSTVIDDLDPETRCGFDWRTAERYKREALIFLKSSWYSTLTLGRDGKKDLPKIYEAIQKRKEEREKRTGGEEV